MVVPPPPPPFTWWSPHCEMCDGSSGERATHATPNRIFSTPMILTDPPPAPPPSFPQHRALTTAAKSKVGIWSKQGVAETRQYFWSSWEGGKGFAKRQVRRSDSDHHVSLNRATLRAEYVWVGTVVGVVADVIVDVGVVWR